ncbi:hypothetical protein Trydic_g19909 [Trypoxylus dichotomus]
MSIINSFGGEAVLHRFSNPHHDWALFKQSQYEVWFPSYTASDISKDESPRKSLTKKTFIVRTTINFLPTKEEDVFKKYSFDLLSFIDIGGGHPPVFPYGSETCLTKCAHAHPCYSLLLIYHRKKTSTILLLLLLQSSHTTMDFHNLCDISICQEPQTLVRELKKWGLILKDGECRCSCCQNNLPLSRSSISR